MVRRIAIGGVALLLLGCSDRPTFNAGEGCELNSDCSPPLVCRLDRCRVECRGLRDCAPGFLCVRDDDGLGACQLDDDRECSLTSECPAPLVCVLGQCTNECATSSDCPAGALCRADGDGALGCVDPSDTQCQLNSDCGGMLICAPDQRCREQCQKSRDCRDGLECVGGVCTSPGRDAGPMDAGPMDGGPIDGGPIDGGPIDGGVDAGPPPSVGALSAGTRHACLASGTDVRCWGQIHQTSTGMIHSFVGPTPIAFSGAAPTTLASGSDHVCGGGAELQCWGDNASGQLGVASPSFTPATAVVSASVPPRAIAAGLAHTCMLDEAGVVSCWGDNTAGQLGDGAALPGSSRSTPMPVVLALPAADITARNRNTCALLIDGSVWCWGANARAQLGANGTIGVSSSMPIQVAMLPAVVEVDLGSEFGCARLAADGSVRCWGSNAGSQLAMPASMPSESPVPVEIAVPAVAEIETGQAHACVLIAADGSVRCWGLNVDGQAGAPTGNFVATPTPVGTLAGVLELTAGDRSNCARLGATAVSCWGHNSFGQLGDGTTTDTHTPVGVMGL